MILEELSIQREIGKPATIGSEELKERSLLLIKIDKLLIDKIDK